MDLKKTMNTDYLGSWDFKKGEKKILTVKEIVGFEGEIFYDKSKPNGTPRKLMDATKIKALGWSPKIKLKEGIQLAYQWYLKK